jgi:hypothetical protein
LIGGTAAGAANVISGNLTGILVGATGPVSNVVIHGNLIGLNAQGTGPLPNTFQGVRLNGSTNDFVGGIQNGAGNKIAFNGGPWRLDLHGHRQFRSRELDLWQWRARNRYRSAVGSDRERSGRQRPRCEQLAELSGDHHCFVERDQYD